MKRNIEGEKKTVKKKNTLRLKRWWWLQKKRARLLQRVKNKTIL